MVLRASLWAAAAVAVVATAPANARGERAAIDVPAVRLDQAISVLGRQSGVSIGFRDPALGAKRVKAVRGRMSADEALRRMLKGTGARVRQVAVGSYLIEADPRSPAPRKVPTRPATPLASSPPPPPEPAMDIIVTATKRDIPLGAYPGLVDIIDGGNISLSQGRDGTDAIAARSASVVSTHLGPGRNKLFIRGIADSSFVGPTQATVGQYWGNSRITYSAPDPSLKLYDLRRIEVLEGPQGTLYGAGSLGGVVRVVPREPQLGHIEGAVWSGVQAVQHGQPGMDGGAIINLPIVEDKLALRVVGFGSLDGGYIDDVGRGLNDVNDVKSVGGRAALRYASDDDLTVDLNLVGQRISGDDSQYTERTSGRLIRSSSIAQPYHNDFVLTDLVVRKRWDDLELTSSVGYASQDVFETFEGLALPDPGNPTFAPDAATALTARYDQRSKVEMLTGEVRLARNGPDGTGWLIAASLLRNEARTQREMGLALAYSPLTGIKNKVEEATIYGEATVQPADRLSLTFGGRLSHSRLSGAAEDALDVVALRNDPLAAASRTETQFIPSLALAYRANDDLTVFARYQEGFRPGGIAVRRDFIERYDSDHVSTWEVGARFIGTDVQLEASASHTDWNNIQADLIDGYGFPTTANVGDGQVFSIGGVVTWRPFSGFELEASAYFNDSEVTEQAAILSLLTESFDKASFDRLPNIADTTARLGFSYWMPLSDRADLRLSGYGRYVGTSILGVGPILGKPQGDYIDTGIEATVGVGAMRWSLALSNLFDARGNRFALGSPFLIRDGNQITPLKPRAVRIGVEYVF